MLSIPHPIRRILNLRCESVKYICSFCSWKRKYNTDGHLSQNTNKRPQTSPRINSKSQHFSAEQSWRQATQSLPPPEKVPRKVAMLPFRVKKGDKRHPVLTLQFGLNSAAASRGQKRSCSRIFNFQVKKHRTTRECHCETLGMLNKMQVMEQYMCTVSHHNISNCSKCTHIMMYKKHI